MRLILIALLFFAIAGPPITLPTPTLSAYRGFDYPIRVKLETQLGAPITNATLFFFHETHNTLLGLASTNQSGHALFLWPIPQNHELGPVLLNATFYGDPERYLLPCYIDIPITIFAQMEISVEVYNADGTPIGSFVYPNQEIIFNVQVRSDLMEPLEGIMISLLDHNQQQLAEGLTVENGSISFSHQLSSPLTSNIVFMIQSASSGYYNGTEFPIPLLVGNYLTSFVDVPAFIGHDEGGLISGRLCLQSGVSIPNATIAFLLEETSLIGSVVTDQEGNFSFSLSNIINGLNSIRYLTLKYEGDIGYNPTQAIVGLLPKSTSTPFFHTIDLDATLEPSLLLTPISILILGCITISSGIVRRKINRTTKCFVSH